MEVSRCRFLRCPECRDVYEKPDLHIKIVSYAGAGIVVATGAALRGMRGNG